MVVITASRTIAAPPSDVFDAVTNIENLPATNPAIVKTEFLTEQRSGVGTKFRETRLMGKRTDETELEVVELVDGERARMVADSHGTVWDTVFTVAPDGAGTRLVIAMDARPHTLPARLMNVLFKGLFRKGLVKHLDALQAFCEARS